MAQFFTNWDFDKGVAQGLERAQRKAQREEQVRQFDENQAFREKELAERIVARKAVDELRERQLAETIRSNQKREGLSERGQDITLRGQDISIDEAQKGRDWRSDEAEKGRDWTEDQAERKYDREDQLLELGKTKEERVKKMTDKAIVSTIPTFEEYDQNEAVTEMQDFLGFDEGEFRRAADDYIGDVQKNLPAILSTIQTNPDDPQVVKHLDDLEAIYEVLDGGEYSGPLDSTIFDWFDGEATGAKKSKAKIARILNAAGRPID